MTETVWVGISVPGYGCDPYPARVFSTEERVRAWCAKNPRDREYEDFKVDDDD